MKHIGQGVPFLLLLFLLFPALYFQLPLSSGSSDLSEIDALATVEVVAKGFKEPTGIVVDSSGAIFATITHAWAPFPHMNLAPNFTQNQVKISA